MGAHGFSRAGAAALLCCAALVSPLAAQSRQDTTASVTLTGFVAAAAFWQSKLLAPADGQASAYAADTTSTQDVYGADMRDTRLGLKLQHGRLAGGWTASGLVSLDFFGGFKGNGTFAFLTPRPRVREAFVRVEHGPTAISLGQIPSTIYPYLPTSPVHRLSTPLGYGSTGVMGSYFPGVRLVQRIGPEQQPHWQVTVAALENAWKDVGGADNIVSPTTLAPQLETRVDAIVPMGQNRKWQAFVAGHWDHKNLAGTDAAEPALTGLLGEAGFKLSTPVWTVAGSGYYGHAVGQQFANLSQFGDITGWGTWAQAGYTFAPHWSLWAFGGWSKQHDDDHPEELLRPENRMVAPMLHYSAGPLDVGLEWMHVATDWFTGPARTRVTRTGDELALGSVLQF